MAREENRASLLLRFPDALSEDGLHERVETGCRLIEQQKVDMGGQRAEIRSTFFSVALGVGAPLFARVEIEALDEIIAFSSIDPASQPREQVDGLPAGQAGPQFDVALGM